AVQDLADVSKEIEQAESHLVKVQDLQGLLKNAGVTLTDDQHVALSAYIQTMTQPKIDEEMLDLGEGVNKKTPEMLGGGLNVMLLIPGAACVVMALHTLVSTQETVLENVGVAQVWPQLSEAALTGPRYFPVDFEPWEAEEPGVIQAGNWANAEEMVCKASGYLVPGTGRNLAGFVFSGIRFHGWELAIGSSIDFGVVCAKLAGCVSVATEWNVPFKPHAALRFTVHKTGASLPVPQPPKFVEAPGENQGDSGEQDISEVVAMFEP
ncbi:unnamed protein product, partial [Symbiodinium necroappetens]